MPVPIDSNLQTNSTELMLSLSLSLSLLLILPILSLLLSLSLLRVVAEDISVFGVNAAIAVVVAACNSAAVADVSYVR